MTIRAMTTSRGELVLDCFAGSGTTIVAVQRMGRRAAALELDPRYCDVIVKRWQQMSGEEAALEGTERRFCDAAGERM